MKHIHLPHSNSTLLTFNKGGSTLFSHTLKLFCDWKGIEIQNEWGRDGKMVIITRNPIDRFYSGFLHFTNWKRGVNGLKYMEWEEDRRNEIQLIESLNEFITDCESGKIEDELGDMHYVRQGKVLDGMDIRDYTQHQIEYLHPQINEGGIWESPSSNLDYSIKGALVDNQKVMDYLPLLGELGIHLSGWDGHFFCSTYQLVLRNLKGGHHRGDSKRLRLLVEGHYPSIGRRIRDWVWEDVKRFGYGDIL